MSSVDDVSGAWEDNAEQWLAWARTPDHDVHHWALNRPEFARLLPGAGRRTLDVGCGEGRVGRWLADAGHHVAGVDSSPTLAALAREAGGYEEVVCADAATLPWPDRHFDLAIAYMTLHDMPNPGAVVDEIARVLVAGALLCVAIVHPLNRPPEHLAAYFHRATVPRDRDARWADDDLRRRRSATGALHASARRRRLRDRGSARAPGVGGARHPSPSARAGRGQARTSCTSAVDWTHLGDLHLSRDDPDRIRGGRTGQRLQSGPIAN